MKGGGTSWISRKGGILEREGGEGVDLEKGGMTPHTNYEGTTGNNPEEISIQ